MTEERTTADDDRGPSPTPALRARLSTAWEHFAGRWQPLSSALDRGTRHSRLAAVAARCREAIANAWIVRWLTREPDPTVVEIDLAATRTVGPIIAVLDRLANVLSTPVVASSVCEGTSWTARSLERHAVPAMGGTLLGLVLGTLALTWDGASLPWLLALAVAGLAGTLALTVEESPQVLAESTAVGLLRAALAPPGDDYQ